MLPTRARRLRFPLRIDGTTLRVSVEAHEVTYTVEEGPGIDIVHYDEPVRVEPGRPTTFAGEFHTRDSDHHPMGAT
jgi:alpha,alpha-trehalose phosphorylase